jgi:MOSC domain-containing protein YiiM
MSGKVEAIFISNASARPMESIHEAALHIGKGIVGDRYYNDTGTFSEQLKGLPDKEVTLIAAEEVDRFNSDYKVSLGYSDLRRNIITRGVDLNELVDKEFDIASVRLKGIRLCEPCATLAESLGVEVLKGFVHKAGLRASIIKEGSIQTGDELSPVI